MYGAHTATQHPIGVCRLIQAFSCYRYSLKNLNIIKRHCMTLAQCVLTVHCILFTIGPVRIHCAALESGSLDPRRECFSPFQGRHLTVSRPYYTHQMKLNYYCWFYYSNLTHTHMTFFHHPIRWKYGDYLVWFMSCTNWVTLDFLSYRKVDLITHSVAQAVLTYHITHHDFLWALLIFEHSLTFALPLLSYDHISHIFSFIHSFIYLLTVCLFNLII